MIKGESRRRFATRSNREQTRETWVSDMLYMLRSFVWIFVASCAHWASRSEKYTYALLRSSEIAVEKMRLLSVQLPSTSAYGRGRVATEKNKLLNKTVANEKRLAKDTVQWATRRSQQQDKNESVQNTERKYRSEGIKLRSVSEKQFSIKIEANEAHGAHC